MLTKTIDSKDYPSLPAHGRINGGGLNICVDIKGTKQENMKMTLIYRFDNGEIK
jgi:hypothetical protein